MVKLLRKRVEKYKFIKIFGVIRERKAVKYIFSATKLVTRNTNLKLFYTADLVAEIKTNLENFEGRCLGYKLKEIKNLTVNVNKCNPLRVRTYVTLPKFIRLKRAVYNGKNMDKNYLLWCLIKKFIPIIPLNNETNKFINDRKRKRVERVSKEYFVLHNFKFSLPLGEIQKFVKVNKISINVYKLEKKKC